MQHQVTSIIAHMARSHEEMAKIIEAKRHVAVHMAQLIDSIPNHPGFGQAEQIKTHSVTVTENITAYLNGLADLEEAIAENLEIVMGEMGESNEE